MLFSGVNNRLTVGLLLPYEWRESNSFKVHSSNDHSDGGGGGETNTSANCSST